MSDYPQMPPAQPQPAQSGLSDNAAGALAYVTIIPAIIFLIVEPYNRNAFVKFHAWQNIFLAIGWFACSIVMIIPIIGWIIGFVGLITFFICWIICIVKAAGGHKFMLPIIGPLALKQAGA
ncbi:MAG TPA: hypothetical protein VHD85_03425 [Terracidiphilus sp.]|nr:hypothetical protein [Terracidiphilus sp.]